MKFKKIKNSFIFILAVTIMFGPVLTQAVELVNPLANAVGGGTLESIVKNVITGALGVSGVLALIAFIVGGISWMTSSGDTAKIQKGKNMMIWAVMGIVIIFSAYAILSFVFKTLGAGGGGNNPTRIGTNPAVNP